MENNDRFLDRMMNLSLGTGFFMLAIKMYALWTTGSAAILSDAAESVVHVVAVLFAAWSLRLARRRADKTHNFGYDRISFFSAGFEGAMILLAACYILFEAGRKFIEGPKLNELGLGTGIEALVVVINGLLGFLLVSVGKKKKSLIVEANGRHVLTDSVTSIGVLLGLLLCLFAKNPWFDSEYFDPIFAAFSALNILKEGFGLTFRAYNGLMDKVSPVEEKGVETFLLDACAQRKVGIHQLRVRNSGTRYWIQFHLVFPDEVLLADAHKTATEIELLLQDRWLNSVTTTHLETQGDHDLIHRNLSNEA